VDYNVYIIWSSRPVYIMYNNISSNDTLCLSIIILSSIVLSVLTITGYTNFFTVFSYLHNLIDLMKYQINLNTDAILYNLVGSDQRDGCLLFRSYLCDMIYVCNKSSHPCTQFWRSREFEDYRTDFCFLNVRFS